MAAEKTLSPRVTKLSPAPRPEFDPARGPSGCLTICVSAPVPDRDDEVVVPRTLRLDSFKANPVVLAVHDQGRFPVGTCEDPAGRFTVRLDDKGWLWADVHFADSAEGRDAAALYRQKVLRGASVGFLSDGTRDLTPAESLAAYGVKKRLREHVGGELLEISCVPVPSCPAALALEWVDPAGARVVVDRGYAHDPAHPLAEVVVKAFGQALARPTVTAMTVGRVTKDEGTPAPPPAPPQAPPQAPPPDPVASAQAELAAAVAALRAEVEALRAWRAGVDADLTAVATTFEAMAPDGSPS